MAHQPQLVVQAAQAVIALDGQHVVGSGRGTACLGFAHAGLLSEREPAYGNADGCREVRKTA